MYIKNILKNFISELLLNKITNDKPTKTVLGLEYDNKNFSKNLDGSKKNSNWQNINMA